MTFLGSRGPRIDY